MVREGFPIIAVLAAVYFAQVRTFMIDLNQTTPPWSTSGKLSGNATPSVVAPLNISVPRVRTNRTETSPQLKHLHKSVSRKLSTVSVPLPTQPSWTSSTHKPAVADEDVRAEAASTDDDNTISNSWLNKLEYFDDERQRNVANSFWALAVSKFIADHLALIPSVLAPPVRVNFPTFIEFDEAANKNFTADEDDQSSPAPMGDDSWSGAPSQDRMATDSESADSTDAAIPSTVSSESYRAGTGRQRRDLVETSDDDVAQSTDSQQDVLDAGSSNINDRYQAPQSPVNSNKAQNQASAYWDAYYNRPRSGSRQQAPASSSSRRGNINSNDYERQNPNTNNPVSFARHGDESRTRTYNSPLPNRAKYTTGYRADNRNNGNYNSPPARRGALPVEYPSYYGKRSATQRQKSIPYGTYDDEYGASASQTVRSRKPYARPSAARERTRILPIVIREEQLRDAGSASGNDGQFNNQDYSNNNQQYFNNNEYNNFDSSGQQWGEGQTEEPQTDNNDLVDYLLYSALLKRG